MTDQAPANKERDWGGGRTWFSWEAYDALPLMLRRLLMLGRRLLRALLRLWFLLRMLGLVVLALIVPPLLLIVIVGKLYPAIVGCGRQGRRNGECRCGHGDQSGAERQAVPLSCPHAASLPVRIVSEAASWTPRHRHHRRRRPKEHTVEITYAGKAKARPSGRAPQRRLISTGSNSASLVVWSFCVSASEPFFKGRAAASASAPCGKKE